MISSSETTPLSVSELNRSVNLLLSAQYRELWVKGELSGLTKPRSGHLYFTLKDKTAQIRAVCFKNQLREENNFQEGDEVLVYGRLALYEPRGDYQLIISEMSPIGQGALFAKFEKLKEKLQKEGLFESSRKKPLKRFPNTIAVITSKTGAAIHDILTTLARRFPIALVHIYPSEVQGETAAKSLINALKKANEDGIADTIILARGGGSMEDLWSFNDETLARTIAESKIPVISGVGHETDFTIADFVADFRAATPTAAACAATPDIFELKDNLNTRLKQLNRAMQGLLSAREWLVKRLKEKVASPFFLLQQHRQTLDFLEHRLARTLTPNIGERAQKLKALQSTLHDEIALKLSNSETEARNLMTRLHTLSPLSTLERGYSIALQGKKVLSSYKEVATGDHIAVKLCKGTLECQVIKTEVL